MKSSKFTALSSEQLTKIIGGGSGTVSILDTDMESIIRKKHTNRATEELFGAY